MTILLFFIVLSLLIFAHELGHFLLAKRFGVGVEEFGFGLPPRLWGRRIGETVYSINLFPFGGFVKLKGEFGRDETNKSGVDGSGGADEGEVLGFGGGRSFSAAPKTRRILIIVGGVLGNLLLAYFLLAVLFGVGYPAFSGRVKVLEVVKDSPAEAAELKAGDYLLEINGVVIADPRQLVEETKKRAGSAVKLKVEGGGGEERRTTLVPRANPPEGQGALGVRIKAEGKIAYKKYSWLEAPRLALFETGAVLREMLSGWRTILGNLFFKREVPEEVAGPVGIYTLTGEAASLGFNVFLQFVAILSLNLFLFNLFPLPALDGGRLLFIGFEALFGRKISPKVEYWVNSLGLAFLIAIFVLVTIQDISRFFG